MGSFSLWHWLVVIMLVLLLFGRGRISDMMGDIGKGLKSFKQGMADEEDEQFRQYSEQRRSGVPTQLPHEHVREAVHQSTRVETPEDRKGF